MFKQIGAKSSPPYFAVWNNLGCVKAYGVRKKPLEVIINSKFSDFWPIKYGQVCVCDMWMAVWRI